METIELVNDGTGLGFGIVGGKTTGVIVKTILPGGIADQVLAFMLLIIFWELVFRRFSIVNSGLRSDYHGNVRFLFRIVSVIMGLIYT